ncbi:MAG: hypothetical protein JWM74_2346 [Myxococcaceae bacterium]|nr:hypothetical protein [Myxococcaceae bacterium]
MKRSHLSALVLLAALALHAPPCLAAEPDADAGRRAFAEGSERMKDGAYAEALDLFVESNRALPSPNTTLLVARCLRELGRTEEAVERFEAAAVDAEARVRAGEAKYQPAANSARTEGATLRASLGVLHVRLFGTKSSEAEVEVEGRRHAVRADGTADVLHQPGEVSFRVLLPDGSRREGSATLTAGRWTSVDVSIIGLTMTTKPAAPIAPPPPTHESSNGWMLPVGIGAAAVGVVGLGSFAIFGVRSQSTFDNLHGRCAPACSGADREEADRGSREQTIANVSLVVGAVALGASITLAVISLSSASRSPDAKLPPLLRGAF